ncbi:MAG: hypothetical protein NTZ05_12320, partial [Chloroflexi bacterium]|nr:hypothetical protein [Chloroflexota bacterium]
PSPLAPRIGGKGPGDRGPVLVSARPGWSCADLHIHTDVSDGMMTAAAVLDYLEQRTAVDVIAVTDHETVDGGLRTRDLAERRSSRIQVIVGEEITTRSGHLLALYLERTVPRFLSLADTLQAIHEQGGIAIAPHPMSPLTFSIGQRALEAVMASPHPGVYLDALETHNHSIAGRVIAGKAARLNRDRYRLAATGSSDAHFPPHLGAAVTWFPGRTADDLRAALTGGQTAPAWVDGPREAVGLRSLLAQQWRSLAVLPARSARRALLSRR